MIGYEVNTDPKQKRNVFTEKKHSQIGDVWKRLSKDKKAMIGLVIIVLITLVAIFAKQLAPYDYTQQDLTNRLRFPCSAHLLGTDNFGRDLLSRIIFGARTSLLVALIAVVISMIIGVGLGASAGYFGGVFEGAVMRVIDIIMAIPGLLLAVSISVALGTGTFNTALAISVSGICTYARISRACVLQLRDQEFIEAARVTGSRDGRIIFKQIMPNILAPIIVDTTLRIGANILQISSLSFIGLGVQPPTAEWGSIMTVGRDYIRDFYPLVTFPGVAIMLTLFGFNLLGDGLRDALDPKLKQ
ncbi:MAG: ABC transporter permease [Saccharofermentanales bacterium]|jgi:peptide/nickel transport system permease protein